MDQEMSDITSHRTDDSSGIGIGDNNTHNTGTSNMQHVPQVDHGPGGSTSQPQQRVPYDQVPVGSAPQPQYIPNSAVPVGSAPQPQYIPNSAVPVGSAPQPQYIPNSAVPVGSAPQPQYIPNSAVPGGSRIRPVPFSQIAAPSHPLLQSPMNIDHQRPFFHPPIVTPYPLYYNHADPPVMHYPCGQSGVPVEMPLPPRHLVHGHPRAVPPEMLLPPHHMVHGPPRAVPHDMRTLPPHHPFRNFPGAVSSEILFPPLHLIRDPPGSRDPQNGNSHLLWAPPLPFLDAYRNQPGLLESLHSILKEIASNPMLKEPPYPGFDTYVAPANVKEKRLLFKSRRNKIIYYVRCINYIGIYVPDRFYDFKAFAIGHLKYITVLSDELIFSAYSKLAMGVTDDYTGRSRFNYIDLTTDNPTLRTFPVITPPTDQHPIGTPCNCNTHHPPGATVQGVASPLNPHLPEQWPHGPQQRPSDLRQRPPLPVRLLPVPEPRPHVPQQRPPPVPGQVPPSAPLPQVPKQEPLSPKQEPLSPKQEPLSPKKEPLSPKKEPLSPKQEPLSPQPGPPSPQPGPLSPKQEPLSPKQEPLSPQPGPSHLQDRGQILTIVISSSDESEDSDSYSSYSWYSSDETVASPPNLLNQELDNNDVAMREENNEKNQRIPANRRGNNSVTVKKENKPKAQKSRASKSNACKTNARKTKARKTKARKAKAIKTKALKTKGRETNSRKSNPKKNTSRETDTPKSSVRKSTSRGTKPHKTRSHKKK